jgi:transposase
MLELARLFIERQNKQYSLFPQDQQNNAAVIDFVRNIQNSQLRTVGPELIFGKIFDQIGFDAIPERLFRDIVIARLVYPTSKAKTVDYLWRYQGKTMSTQSIYRFLDRLNDQYSLQAQHIAYKHSLSILTHITVVFYDMTSLYFESEDEDDLRKIGFSKDGKFQNPQIMLGLLVGSNG